MRIRESEAQYLFLHFSDALEKGNCRLVPISISLDERIAHGEIRKPPEMAISGPQLAHTMQATEGGNVRIVHLWTGDLAFLDGVTQLDPVPAHFGKECEARRL
ncbi:protein of unknown function [Candidatus Methylomirabilis oxygeniifera]|uniref:Uncharacterized protein n=1 Tax=Methylomirabilis oxygeniifera TaxID=671143 RepID=D5MKC8_METO1|nr:protein of unknown function [Candidatus Methylomirabilis oxyfera]